MTDNSFIAASIGWILINTTYHIESTVANKGTLKGKSYRICRKLALSKIIVLPTIKCIGIAALLSTHYNGLCLMFVCFLESLSLLQKYHYQVMVRSDDL